MRHAVFAVECNQHGQACRSQCKDDLQNGDGWWDVELDRTPHGRNGTRGLSKVWGIKATL